MLHVSIDGYAESFFCAFHKVATATTVYVHFDTARHYYAALSVDHLSAFDVKVAVGNRFNLVSVDNYRAAFKPTLGSQDATIDDLLKHNKILFCVLTQGGQAYEYTNTHCGKCLSALQMYILFSNFAFKL